MTASAIEDDLRLNEPAGDAVLGWLEEARTCSAGWPPAMVTRLLLVTETSPLDPDTRRVVDAQLVAAQVDRMAPWQAAGTARRLGYTADPHGSVRRARMAREDRRVGLRPLPDTMAGLSACLPVEPGVACWAALKAQVDTLKTAGDPRTRGQIAADTLVERLTGQAAADDIDVEVQITTPVENLLGPNQHQPADIHGFGPIPAGLADQIIGRTTGSRRWRRLFTTPTRDGRSSITVGGDPAARRFTGWLGQTDHPADRCCREPFCTARSDTSTTSLPPATAA